MIDKSKRYLRALAAVASNWPVTKDIAGAVARGGFYDARRMAHTATRVPDLGAEKIVSRKYRYLWLCVPKVASRSIMRALCNTDPDAEIICNKRVGEVYAMRPEARGYYSFAFVRHPFDRMFSFYRELHVAHRIYTGEQRLHKAEKRQSLFRRFYGLAETRNFDDVCEWLNTPYGSDAFADRHFLSQHLQIHLEDGRLPDFIGRFENIAADLNRVTAHLGMPALALPMLNTMDGWQSTPEALNAARRARDAQLTERNKALIRTRYAGDFDLGGYSPD